MKSFSLVLLSSLLLFAVSPIWADDCEPCEKVRKSDWCDEVCSITDGVLKHIPKIVRAGADLYGLRLELIGEFYKKEKADKKTNKLTGRVKKVIEKLGKSVVRMVVDLRKRAGDKTFKKLLKMWKRKRAKRVRIKKRINRQICGPMMPPMQMHGAPMVAPPPPPPPAPARMRQGFFARLRRVGQKIKRWHAHFEKLTKELSLDNQQRIDAKLVIIGYVPTVVRHGANVASEGMEISRLLLSDEINEEKCEKHIEKLASAVGTIVNNVVDMAFEIKALLKKKQQQHLLANIPLRVILLR